jgi:predicted SprT family Zn-dependent metalloprotease
MAFYSALIPRLYGRIVALQLEYAATEVYACLWVWRYENHGPHSCPAVDTSAFAIQCEECAERCASDEGLREHMAANHSFTCEVCHTILRSQAALDAHKTANHYLCPECDTWVRFRNPLSKQHSCLSPSFPIFPPPLVFFELISHPFKFGVRNRFVNSRSFLPSFLGHVRFGLVAGEPSVCERARPCCASMALRFWLWYLPRSS